MVYIDQRDDKRSPVQPLGALLWTFFVRVFDRVDDELGGLDALLIVNLVDSRYNFIVAHNQGDPYRLVTSSLETDVINGFRLYPLLGRS